VEARIVGEGCVVEVNAKIGKGAVLGKVYISLYNDGIRRLTKLIAALQDWTVM
jgi:hypothetical protein